MSRGDLWRAAAMAALGALFLAGLALINRRPEAPAAREMAPAAAAMPDDLSAELRRCAWLGQPQAGDARCTAVWEENRRRFFGRPALPITHTAAPVTDAVSSLVPAENQGGAR